MSEAFVRDPFSAGALIRAEREKQGLHIAALAASIKVTPRKLDALENDRWAELPDATFTRALAQTVCRTLKMDPKPVLDRLPAVEPSALDGKPGGLNAPFNDRGSSGDGAAALVAAVRPLAWAGLALMVAAVALYLFPPAWLPSSTPSAASLPRTAAAPAPAEASVAATPAPVPESAASAASAAAFDGLPLQPSAAPLMAASAPPGPLPLPPVTSNPPPVPASAPQIVVPPSVLLAAPAVAAPPPAVAAAPAGLVLLRASANSWVEARDGRGRVLVSRLVASGEELGLDGALPIRMTIGNAQATTLAFRGQPVDLQARSRDNVARIELQ